MDPISAVGSALGSLNAAIELARAAVGAKVDAEVRAKVADAMGALIESQTQLLDARMQMHDIVDENRRLKRQLEEREEWTARAAQFKLVQAPGGAMVHAFQGEPAHYACPACFENKHLHILQDLHAVSGGYRCPSCDKVFNVKPKQKVDHLGREGGSWMSS